MSQTGPSADLSNMSHPVACFASLPQELKANVLRLVAEAEVAWRQRLEGVLPQYRTMAKTAHVDGLQAASLVCKEWGSLAGQFIFETLTLKGILSPLFRHGILRTHGHRFKKVLLVQYDGDEDGDEDDEYIKSTIELDYALSILPFLPNLRALTLNDSAAYHLFGSDLDIDVHQNDIEGMRSSTLRQVAEGVDELNLLNFCPGEAGRVLALWPTVRRLRLGGLQITTDDGDMDEVVKALTGLKLLEHLHLELTTHTLHTPSTDILPVFYTCPIVTLIIAEGIHNINLNPDCPLTLLFKNFPTLRQLDLHPSEAAGVSLVTDLCANRDLPPPTVAPFGDKAFIEGITDSANGLVCDGLESVLDWGKLEVGRLRAGGRVADSVELLESLRQLDAHRQRWMD
ncbi:hypothetical protein RQP46_005840 [Phenoliferia psychrophenolica]